MKNFIILSLLLNIAVLVPVCTGLMADAQWTQEGYGAATPARGILLSIYLAVLFASCLFLVFRNPGSVAALLLVQVVYKLSTPLTVGTLQSPVVLSNLGIAVLHVLTLVVVWRAIGNPFKAPDTDGTGRGTPQRV